MQFQTQAPRRRMRWLPIATLLLSLAGLMIWVLDRREQIEAGIAGTFGDHTASLPANTTEAQADAATIPIEKSPDVAAIAPDQPPATAHRAPLALREQDRSSFDSDTDLGIFAAELQVRANAGDADAAMMLAELHQACGALSRLAPESTHLPDNDREMLLTLQISEADVAVVEGKLIGMRARCGAWPKADIDQTGDLIAAWQARAATLGHPGARLSQQPPPASDRSASAEQARARLRAAGIEVLEQRNPEDLVRYALELAELSPYDYTAFVYAGCQFNEECAADPMAYARHQAGLREYAGTMGYLVLLDLSPRRLLVVSAQASELLNLWQAGRFDLLLSGNPDGEGDGG